jgi:hypothetical protein
VNAAAGGGAGGGVETSQKVEVTCVNGRTFEGDAVLVTVGPLYNLNALYPSLESAWFQFQTQPLNLKC